VQPVLDKLREMSGLTSREALKDLPEAEADRLIEVLLKIKANMLALEAKAAGDGGRKESPGKG